MKSFSIIGIGLVMAFIAFAGRSDAGAQERGSAKPDKMQVHKSISGHDHTSMTKDKITDKKNESMTVNGIVVKAQTFDNTLSLSGSIEANEQVDIRSEVSGIVEGIYFNEGRFTGFFE